MPSFAFSRQSRLLSPADFRAVFKAGYRLRRGPFQFIAVANAAQRPRLGIAVSKRNVRRAAARNLIKRTVRESFRLNQQALPDIDIVVLVQPGAAGLGRGVLRAALDAAWSDVADSRPPQRAHG